MTPMSQTRGSPEDLPFNPAELGIGRLFEATQDAIVVTDDSGRILLWNAAAKRIFGYDEQEAVGMNVDRLVPSSYKDAHHAGMERYRRTGHGRLIDAGRPAEVPAAHKEGHEVWVDLTLSPVLHEGRHYALAILRDVTDRVRLRDQRELDQKQLRDAYDSLEAFTYVVSHDLKEPVRGVSFYLDTLLEETPEPERRELVERAVDSHRNLQRLLEGLLDWSRAAMTPLEPRALRIHEVLRDPGCAVQWEHLLRERSARLEVSPDIPPVLATEALVCRVFGNLITNAIRHNPNPQPHVRVRLGEATTAARVEVVLEDDGPGFPDVILSRVDHLKNRPSTLKGGFGLAVTHRALERLHGAIHLENRAEGGGRVRVELPAARQERMMTLEQRVRELV